MTVVIPAPAGMTHDSNVLYVQSPSRVIGPCAYTAVTPMKAGMAEDGTVL
jgi:hypothetical protein